VNLVWNDEDNRDGIRPSTVNVYLMANGEVIRSLTLSEGGWSASIAGLPTRTADGQPIVYTWAATAATGYTQVINVNGTATTVVYTHVPSTEDTNTWHQVRVQYQYLDGTPASADAVASYQPGTSYSLPVQNIPGYIPSVQVVEGVMGDHDVTYTVIYVPNETTGLDGVNTPVRIFNIGDYETALGLGEVYVNTGDCFE
jgi:hypothetical protein